GWAGDACAATAASEGGQLVLTDVVLPDGNGRELFESLSRGRPGLRVLFMSGYTDDEVLRQGLPEGIPLVRTPMRPHELLRVIRAGLAGARVAGAVTRRRGGAHVQGGEAALPRRRTHPPRWPPRPKAGDPPPTPPPFEATE